MPIAARFIRSSRTSITRSRALSLVAILLVLFGLIGTLNFFSNLPLHLQDIPGLPFHANNQGSSVETKQGTRAGANPTATAASDGVTSSTPTPNESNSPPQVHITPLVGRSDAPTVGGTVIPSIPLTHNILCASGSLKLDSSQNLQPLLQQVDVDYINACHELTI